MSETCPKCGHRRAADSAAPHWQCPSCGIAYAKFRAAPPAVGAAAALPRPPPLHRGETNAFADVALATAVLATLMMAGKAWLGDGMGFVDGLLMVPFYFCAIPVASFFARREVWVWNRDIARFECLDFSQRAWLGWLTLAFYGAASVVFAVFFFTLEHQ